MDIATSLVFVVCVLELVFYCNGFARVTKLSMITVELGRSALVDPQRDLQITYPEGAVCRVVVLRTDPLSQRVGFLTPDTFPCGFSLGDVQYSHLGSKFFMQDFVKLQIRVDTDTETRLIPLNLRVTVSFTDREIIKKNEPIKVLELGGTSSQINSDVLQFKEDRTKTCTVTLLDGAIPRYGKLVNATMDQGNSAQFDCQEFLQSNIRYKHTERSSSNRDFIPAVVEMLDPNTDRIQREYFQIIVLIMVARSNQRPVASFESSHTVEVSQYSIAPITSDILAATDTETETGDVIFNITQALQPVEGSLVNTDDPYQPLTAFYQRDIEQLKIAYRPPSTQSDQRRMFQVVLEAVDTEGAKSEQIVLYILVKPTNYKAPVVTKNTGLSLFEGQSRNLTEELNLAIADKDNFNEVRVQVISGLRHGELRIMGHKVDTFMATDLQIPVINYCHDNSDTYSDNIIFQMTDGEHQVTFLFPITIGPVDDTAPTLVRNTGLVLDEGGVGLIDQYMLTATDVDSEDSKIQFKAVTTADSAGNSGSALFQDSKIGVLCLRTRDAPLENDTWVLQDDGFYEKNVSQFSQSDIENRRLYYRHLGGEYFHHEIPFILLDQAKNPNSSPIKTFQVTIRRVDDLPPTLFPGCVLELNAEEYGLTYLTEDVLLYTDRDSNDDEITFHITKRPYFIDENSNISLFAGDIIVADAKTTVSKFTQFQVRHRKVAFKSADLELGTRTRYAQFVFSVSDLSGNAIKNQIFRVVLRPVNNQAPRAIVKPLKVTELSNAIIGSQQLRVFDADTPNSGISFTLISAPRYGVLLKDDREIQTLDTFTVQDVATSRISYEHLIKGEASDEIGMTVDDRAQRTSFLLEIIITPQKPNVTGHVYNMTVRVKEHSREAIKMHKTSQGPHDADIRLRIETPPRVGRILREGKTSHEFTVQDLENGLIFYEHTGRETGLRGDLDHFNLTLLNETETWIREGRRYEGVEVVTMILPVDSQPPVVRIQQLVVQEGGAAKLTSRHLTITDPDTPDSDVTCIIDVQPTVGFLENATPSPGSEISNTGKRVASFTIDDIEAGKLNYVQNVFEGTEPTMDWIAFYCTDGKNPSRRHLLKIEVQPQNDEKPQMFTGDFVVDEGEEMIIDVAVLNAADKDEPLDELFFMVVTPPRHGMITDRKDGATSPVTMFSLTQIKKVASIVYQHDGSESTEDSFALCVSDDKHNITRTIPVYIIPVDDEEPVLSVNAGLRIEAAGETKTITPKNLQAQDVDSPDDNIRFIVRIPPRAGKLIKIKSDGAAGVLRKDERFTQKDIKERRIVYSQDAKIPSDRDQIKFDLTDGKNTRLNQDFYVKIYAGDRIHPTVINKGILLEQNSRMVISTNFLSANDEGSDNEKLRYSIIRQPLKGRLEHLDFPRVRLTSFTQLDLAANKIVYVHTSSDEATADGFDFEVSDGTNKVLRRFLVTLINRNNKKPVLTSNKLAVNEGENVLITPFELRAEDQDTPAENIVYTVTRLPMHGWILNGASPSSVFTQEDINLNQISYAHDGTEVNKDSFQIVISDGIHNEFFVFPETKNPVREGYDIPITILPVDNRIPQLVLNRGATNLDTLPGNRLGFVIKNSYLRVEDLDSNNSELLYTVTYQPINGILAGTGRYHSNTSLANFTQADIDCGNVTYVLRSGSNATNDAFDFEVNDPVGNKLRYQRFSLTWSWVMLERFNYEINETDGVLHVAVFRRGFLGDVSFVRISVTGLTATRGEDFSLIGSTHVQFSPGQSRAESKLRIEDDGKYEGYETLKVDLISSQMCVIREPKSAHVVITDPEDVPTVEVVRSQIVVEENVGEVKVPLRRTGDASQRLDVTCLTTSRMEEGWATGTLPSSILSYSDFISRPGNKDSVVAFEKGETTKNCTVTVIDDSLYENEEKFYVTVLSHLGSRTNSQRNTCVVVITPDVRDEPKMFFDPPRYSVDESAVKIDVMLRRIGTDLSKSSTVFVRSRQADPISATAGEDYTPVIQMVHFSPYSERQTVEVHIRDDQGLPRVEGIEEFELVLRTPINSGIVEPSKAVVAISDTLSDLPTIQFVKFSDSTSEKTGTFYAVLMRTGDLTYTSSVRCFTRSMTARVVQDFKERPDTNESIVVFKPGENRKTCPLAIVDDFRFEGKESLTLRLRAVDKESRIGQRNTSVITISDTEDKPVIQFTKERLYVTGPVVAGTSAVASLTVRRTGDPTARLRVRIYTLDGSAKAERDYLPTTKVLQLSGDKLSHVIQVQILYDEDRKIRRAFTVHLTPDYSGESDLGTRKVIVYIEQPSSNPAVTFPLPPRVVSLLDYDDVSAAESQIIMGYPVICVTACDPKHPRYAETGSICSTQRINNRLTQFRWQVGKDQKDLTMGTFFARTDRVTLDGVFLLPGTQVRCVARAVSDRGELGLESTSRKVNVSSEEGLCVSPNHQRMGSQDIEASISFTGATGDQFSNKVHIKVVLPHTDGLIPLLSTNRLINLKRILRPGVLRLAKHKCSNLLDLNEITTSFGFVTDSFEDRKGANEGEPYQYSAELRENKTLRFYRSLDLESCLWTFNTYYDISELIQYCGATVTSDQKSSQISQSQLTVRVPLHLSYVYRVPRTRGDWVHFDHTIFLRLQLSYDTAVMLNNGVQTPEGGFFGGELWPTAISVSEKDKRLVVNFKTKTRFRGTYLVENPATETTALVMSRDRPHLSFSLSLVSSEKTYDNPQQSWQFRSHYSLRDYTGVYFIKLIPCTADAGIRYSEPLKCHPRDPVTFTLPIRFQQVPDPVPAQFTLSAHFLLLSERDQWLNTDPDQTDVDVDAAFSKDSKIYGRISLLEGSGLGRGGKGYSVEARKVYLCTGVGEFIPTYNPSKNMYGCMARSLFLQHRLKVLDKEVPETVDTHFSSVPFHAKFAEELNTTSFSEDPGSDGFVINSAPLFEVPESRKWFMHAIYSVSPGSRSRSSRSVKLPGAHEGDEVLSGTSLISHVVSEVDSNIEPRIFRRNADDKDFFGATGQGTNIKMIRLLIEPGADKNDRKASSEKLEEQSKTISASDTSLVNPLVIGIAVVCVILLVALLTMVVLFRRKLLTQQSGNAAPV